VAVVGTGTRGRILVQAVPLQVCQSHGREAECICPARHNAVIVVTLNAFNLKGRSTRVLEGTSFASSNYEEG